MRVISSVGIEVALDTVAGWDEPGFHEAVLIATGDDGSTESDFREARRLVEGGQTTAAIDLHAGGRRVPASTSGYLARGVESYALGPRGRRRGPCPDGVPAARQ